MEACKSTYFFRSQSLFSRLIFVLGIVFLLIRECYLIYAYYCLLFCLAKRAGSVKLEKTRFAGSNAVAKYMDILYYLASIFGLGDCIHGGCVATVKEKYLYC